MDRNAELGDRLDDAAVAEPPWTGTLEDDPGEGEGGSPSLTLDGYSGPLDHLLTLARGQKIDLLRISLGALLDQLTAALRQVSAKIPLGQDGDWVVMAAWLVQLRSRLLLPADALAQLEAAADAEGLRTRLVALDAVKALAGWLERRPQLGHDVFARGTQEIFGLSVEPGLAVDVIEFLWASLALFDDAVAPETTAVYRPRPFEPYPVAEARDRILSRLAALPDGAPLERFLPEPPEIADAAVWDKNGAPVGVGLDADGRVGVGETGRGGAGAGG